MGIRHPIQPLRPAAEVEAAWKEDPIERCSELLSRLGISREILNEHRKIALEEMERVYKTARKRRGPAMIMLFPMYKTLVIHAKEHFNG